MTKTVSLARRSIALGSALMVCPAFARADASLNPVVVVSPVTPPPGADGGAPPSSTLLGVGVATLVLGYGPSWSVAMSSDHKGDEMLLVPVVGPWFDLAGRGCTGETTSCGTSALERAALITDGVVQGLGALQIMGAFFVSQKPTAGWTAPPMPPFAIVPTMFGGHGVGALGRGRF